MQIENKVNKGTFEPNWVDWVGFPMGWRQRSFKKMCGEIWKHATFVVEKTHAFVAHCWTIVIRGGKGFSPNPQYEGIWSCYNSSCWVFHILSFLAMILMQEKSETEWCRSVGVLRSPAKCIGRKSWGVNGMSKMPFLLETWNITVLLFFFQLIRTVNQKRSQHPNAWFHNFVKCNIPQSGYLASVNSSNLTCQDPIAGLDSKID